MKRFHRRFNSDFFASLEAQRAFEELFVRAKMLHLNYVPLSIWAKVLRGQGGEKEHHFVRVFSISRVIAK